VKSENRYSSLRTLQALALATAYALVFVASGRAEPPAKPNIFSWPLWTIRGNPGFVTWVEIQNGEEAKKTGVAHIEVACYRKGAPNDCFHLCNHMAITTEALEKSVLRPRKTGAMYPESYQGALRQWQADEKAGKAVIYNKTIQEVLKLGGV